MDIKAMDAVKAYGQANSALTPGVGGPRSASAEGEGIGSGFADLVTDALQDTRQASANLEVASAQAVSGKGDIVDVVTAASNAEMMVQTVVTVRDKVLDAYKDIIKMPI